MRPCGIQCLAVMPGSARRAPLRPRLARRLALRGASEGQQVAPG
jgi:hypothetical protein